jgi:hypothetical protein
MPINIKKLLLGSALCFSLAYCADRYIQSEKAEELREEAKAAQFEKNKATIRALITQYSASYDWYRLFDRSHRSLSGPLMQADLENAWLGKSPVIFLGRIDDYKYAKDGSYQVTIKPDIFSFGLFVSGVGLDVTGAQSLVDKFIEKHPEALSAYPRPKGGSVVVIAKIQEIEKRWEGLGEDAEKVRYGVGELLDIRFIEGQIPFGKGDELFSEVNRF